MRNPTAGADEFNDTGISWSRLRLLFPTFLLCSMLGFIAIRMIGIDRSITVDEGIWLGRSANFYVALSQGELQHTFQFAHPGVTTMWAGALGYLVAAREYAAVVTDQILIPFDVHIHLREADLDELSVLVATRTAIIVVRALLFGLSIWFISKLFSKPIAALTAVLIIFNPFLIGHDRLLHVDAMLASTMFAAVLALAHAAQQRWYSEWWAVAGTLAATAWLSRNTGIVLIGIAGATSLITAIILVVQSRLTIANALRRVLVQGALWGGAALITTIALFPALWVAPGAVLGEMVRWSTFAASAGHEHPLFFYGIVYGDPGVWFYPVSILWRITPLIVIALVIALALVLFRRSDVVPKRYATPLLIIGSFTAFFLIGMTLGAKKFDRYVLPVYPVIDLIAAIGLVGAYHLIRDSLRSLTARRIVLTTGIGIILVSQATATWSVRPYMLDYYNPVLGGSAEAPNAMLVGWGEGLDRAADFILSRDDGSHAEIRTSVQRNSLLYFLPPTATASLHPFSPGAQGAQEWDETDYYVAYVMQWQRDMQHSTIDYLAQFPADHTVWVNGMEYARVYDLSEIPIPGWMRE